LQRGELAPIRVSAKRIAMWTGPIRVTVSFVKPPPLGATQPEPCVIAQYGLQRTRISVAPGAWA
jgi:hypothetical protein